MQNYRIDENKNKKPFGERWAPLEPKSVSSLASNIQTSQFKLGFTRVLGNKWEFFEITPQNEAGDSKETKNGPHFGERWAPLELK